MVNKKDFFTIDHGDELTDNLSVDFNDSVVSYVMSQLEYFKNARREKEDIWLECWAFYLGSKQARESLKGKMLASVGQNNNDWRHNLTTGKAFEQVETILAYLQQAFFPNRDWFDVVPLEPGHAELVDVIKQFSRKKLIESNFISHWEMFLRQMIITGSSILALPWRYETAKYKKRIKIKRPDDFSFEYNEKAKFKEVSEDRVIQNHPDFEVLDVFDCFLDPKAIDLNKSDFIRRVLKTKAEVAEMIKTGFYKDVDVLDVVKTSPYAHHMDADIRANSELLDTFQGFTIEGGYHWSQEIELYEYWGDVTVDGTTYKDVTATLLGNKLVRFENNPYWCGKPFVLGTYTPVVRSTAAMGVIEPGLGMLHELDILTNQRLDNLELSIDSMWEYVNDGTLQPEDIYTKPGRVFTVNQPGTLIPVQTSQNFTITYDESAVLEQRIDKNAGTGNLISSNAARDAERVTAAEVKATRDAGGNRLSGVHKHIEETALILTLNKLFRLFQQFVTEDEIVRIPGENPGDFQFLEVGQEELQHDFKVTPVGADHIADKEFEVAQRLQFLNVVSSNPQMSQHINYFNFMVDLARRLGIDDIEMFIQEETAREDAMNLAGAGGQPQPGGGMPMGGEGNMAQSLAEVGGNTLASTIENNIKADGGQNLTQQTFGVDPNAQL